MSINSEMTNLADAIRAKSGVSGKLTITEMTDAVEGIEINQGSDIDFTGVNVTSNKMLAGTVAINASGTKVSGTIQTVTATLSGNVTTVPAGYIAEKQTLTVTEAAAPTTSGNVVTINKGYHSAQKKITVGTTKAAATYTPSTADQSIAAGTYLSGKQTIKGDANLTAENIKSGVTIFNVEGAFEGTGGGGGGSGTFDLAKVTKYAPYAPAMTAVTAVSVSGMGSFGDEEDFTAANGTYRVTAETAGESDWKKRIYKHESEDYYLFYYVDPEYSEDAYWQFGYDTDSSFLSLSSSENIYSGENYWENWDWGDGFTLTTNVTETSIPETPMVLKGVLATGYADGEWSFATAEKSFAGFEKEPKESFIYAVSNSKLIGEAIGFDMDVPAGTVFFFDNSLTDVVGGIPVTNSGLTASSAGIVCANGKYAEIPAGMLPPDVMCDNKPWTFEIKFRCLDPASSWSNRCLFGRGYSPSRFDVLVNKNSIAIGGMNNEISAPLNDTAWHIYKIAHTDANVFTTYLDDAFSKSTSSSGYDMRDYQMWIGYDGESRYGSPFEIEYVRIGNTVEV